jgi:hypothetical protein
LVLSSSLALGVFGEIEICAALKSASTSFKGEIKYVQRFNQLQPKTVETEDGGVNVQKTA